jgi:tRNA pseudouridine13 synthase
VAVFASSPETFFVEEIPAYLPAGEGPHTFLWIEKQGLATPEAVKRLARALGVNDRDVGYAGMKDRHATTRQWVSVPAVDPAAALAAEVPGLKVLEARRHGNKLRTGHLRGNRFEVVLAEVTDAEGELLGERLRALGRDGLPNTYGAQRFGAAGDNVRAGLEILRGQRRERDHRRRKLLLSAVQSEVFNRTLARRAATGGLLRVRPGDVLQKTGSGGLFVTDDLARDQGRVDAGELVPTGPLPGSREVEPPPDSEAYALESEALGEVGVTRQELAAVGRDLPGARRPVLVRVTLDEPAAQREPGRLRLRFSLPAGSYATVVLQALAAPENAVSVLGSPVPDPVLTFRVPAGS